METADLQHRQMASFPSKLKYTAAQRRSAEYGNRPWQRSRAPHSATFRSLVSGMPQEHVDMLRVGLPDVAGTPYTSRAFT